VTAPAASSIPAASTVPAPGPSAVRRSLLTQADSGLTVLLPLGAEVTVVLTPAMQAAMWDQPAVQGGAVVRVSVTGGYPSHQPARAVFRAVTPGTARLTSQSDLTCFHQTPPCAAPTQLWEVTVLVPGHPMNPASPVNPAAS
jgi:hypothetical protein